MTARGPGGAHNGNPKAPVRKDLTGPNQRWCGDISCLMTGQKGVYLYLYLRLDEWSRKAIQWRISWQQTAGESRLLLEGGLAEQNILDLPEDQRPELINDRGRQMKAKPIQRLRASSRSITSASSRCSRPSSHATRWKAAAWAWRWSKNPRPFRRPHRGGVRSRPRHRLPDHLA